MKKKKDTTTFNPADTFGDFNDDFFNNNGGNQEDENSAVKPVKEWEGAITGRNHGNSKKRVDTDGWEF